MLLVLLLLDACSGGGGSATLQSISISASSFTSAVGLTQQLAATGTYSDGTTASVTSTAQWTSSNPSVATVGPTTGLATGVSIGFTTISATIGSVTQHASLTIVGHNAWLPGANMATPRGDHTATLLSSGKVLVAGGDTDGAGDSPVTPAAELYDAAANTWSPAGSMSTARVEHTATLLPNGKVLVAGGLIGGAGFNVTAAAELYDPIANTWSAAASMSIPRYYHTATLLQSGVVLVAGGGGPGASGSLPSAELYDPVSNTWMPAGNMSIGVTDHTATLLPNGQVLVAGGQTSGGNSGPIAAAELYDPVANTWSPAASMSIPRDLHTATLLANGTVLIAGGYSGVSKTATAELYDPGANTWSLTDSMSNARAGHTATLLQNGKVLVTGGFTNDVAFYTATAELYDPSANAWSPATSMSVERTQHKATLLPDGKVLVVGGFVVPTPLGGGDLSTSIELYYP
jgi:N-acetylneuraminic acid mutarotase